MSDPTLFAATFHVDEKDTENYERTARLKCTSTPDQSISVVLDIDTNSFSCAVDDTISLACASTLSLDSKTGGGGDGDADDADGGGAGSGGGAAGGEKSWEDVASGVKTLANDYDYVMHGMKYHIEANDAAANLTIYISAGGLLFVINGPASQLRPLVRESCYILAKK